MINKTTDMFLSDFMTAAIADAAGLSPAEVGIERTRIAGEADFTTTAALRLSRARGMAPRKLAETMAEALGHRPEFARVSVTGPGFVNVTVNSRLLREMAHAVLFMDETGPAIGHLPRRVSVEYVSANPTGQIPASRPPAPLPRSRCRRHRA